MTIHHRLAGRMRLGTALAVAAIGVAGGVGLTAVAVPAASALPCQTCSPPPPPIPPPVTPVLNIDLARQTPDRSTVNVVGWTADNNAPTTPLTVRISVDGAAATTQTANLSRPDVAAEYPKYGPNHGYEVTIPASQSPQQVCVTAVHVGSGADSTVCRQIDDVVGFAANTISYNVADAQILAASLDELDTVTNTNSTNVQQSTTISGQATLTDTQSWTDTYGVKVTLSAGIAIPIFVNSSVSVEGSATFTQNGSTTTAVTFSWQQPVLVPAKSQVVASVAVSRTTLQVPYILTGNSVYASGATAPYSIDGTYSGVNSHDLAVTLNQYNLNGSPAEDPVQQPAANFLKVS